jgi:hypothetical protein
MKTLPKTTLPPGALPPPAPAIEKELRPPDAGGGDRKRWNLAAEDWEALKRQGSIHRERRGNTWIYKLRFRRAGKQTVRYLGGAAAARKFAEVLAAWQAPRRTARRLKQLTQLARRRLRESKKTLTPQLERCGYHYHGLLIRRRRSSRGVPAGEAARTPQRPPRINQSSNSEGGADAPAC